MSSQMWISYPCTSLYKDLYIKIFHDFVETLVALNKALDILLIIKRFLIVYEKTKYQLMQITACPLGYERIKSLGVHRNICIFYVNEVVLAWWKLFTNPQSNENAEFLKNIVSKMIPKF